MRYWLGLLIAVAGCPKSGPSVEPTPEFEPPQKHDKSKTDAQDPCSPEALKLSAATKLLDSWKLPASCAVQGTGTVVIKTQAEATKRFDCGGAKLGVDFAKSSIVVTSRSLSPATVGVDAFDDGKTITFVDRFRPPCSRDPHPMPSPPLTFVYLVTPGNRAFADASCTVESKCP